jgi:hypothetical protein
LLVVLIVSWTSSGIDAPSSSPPTASSSPTQPHRLSQGEALYLRHCADCHGWEGRGDGPVARIFEVKAPRLRGAERFTQFREAELMQPFCTVWSCRPAPTHRHRRSLNPR